ncbi:MAG: hypothetical protein HQL89_07905 [Magnetococcales bacterium]|nr:hypothetical protein [Magnetococcales bacterium]
MSSTRYAYAFAASGIRAFLVAGGKLRDTVGASEMVESLATDLLDAVLNSLNYEEPQLQFSRRGGGAFTVVSSDRIQLERLRDLWSLTVRQVLPGLAFQQGLGEGDDEYQAIANAMKRAERDPNSVQPHIPQAGPLTERNPRTGWPATTLKKYHDGHEFLDPATKAKRHPHFSGGTRLYHRVTPQRGNGGNPWIWPVLLYADEAHEADVAGRRTNPILPYKGENHYVAAIHADGNGMGGILAELARNGRNAPGEYPGLMNNFSEAVSRAVEDAAREAVAVLTPEAVDDVLPGRPILLGGDDFSMIVRADLALEFTRVFLQAFETQSGEALRCLAGKHPAIQFPQRLTACAGIAFFKARQPFGLAFELADSLCKYAKKRVRKLPVSKENNRVPSAVAFHRIGSSVFHDYENILSSEMTVADDPPMRLTLQPYGVGEKVRELPELTDLMELARFMNLKEVRSGHARQLLTLLRLSRAEARKRYGRWRENLDPKRNKKAPKGEVLNRFDAHLKKLGCKEPQNFPELVDDVDGDCATPLGDVMALLAMGAEA